MIDGVTQKDHFEANNEFPRDFLQKSRFSTSCLAISVLDVFLFDDFYCGYDFSIVVDAGSKDAAGLGLGSYPTRTDKAGDTGIVDMGYHYPTKPVVD